MVMDSDMRWFWAAYRRGWLRELIDEGLSKDGFAERMIEIIGAVDYDWIIEARGTEGIRPVGLVLAHSFPDGRIVVPHVDWFPWATSRNIMEGSAVYLREVNKRFKIFIYSDEQSEPFWHRMVQYRILRRGCKVIDHFSRGDFSMFYYTRGP